MLELVVAWAQGHPWAFFAIFLIVCAVVNHLAGRVDLWLAKPKK